MEIVFAVVKYGVLGFFALIASLFVLAVMFGKRIEKKWEYEAEFRDANRREIGEFDIELRRIPKDGTDWHLKAKLILRHPTLTAGQTVQVYLEDVLVMEGLVEKDGRVWLRDEHVCGEIKDPATGQICSIHYAGAELMAEPLYPD